MQPCVPRSPLGAPHPSGPKHWAWVCVLVRSGHLLHPLRLLIHARTSGRLPARFCHRRSGAGADRVTGDGGRPVHLAGGEGQSHRDAVGRRREREDAAEAGVGSALPAVLQGCVRDRVGRGPDPVSRPEVRAGVQLLARRRAPARHLALDDRGQLRHSRSRSGRRSSTSIRWARPRGRTGCGRDPTAWNRRSDSASSTFRTGERMRSRSGSSTWARGSSSPTGSCCRSRSRT